MLPFVKCVSQKDLQLQVDAKVIFIDYCALVLAVALPFLLRFRQEWRYAVPTEVSSVKFCRHWRRYSFPTELQVVSFPMNFYRRRRMVGQGHFSATAIFKNDGKTTIIFLSFIDLHKGECPGCIFCSLIDYKSWTKIKAVSGLTQGDVISAQKGSKLLMEEIIYW